jgi:hypothetical protein
MNVLIFIPYHSTKHYCLSHLFKWIDAQKGHDVVLRADTGEYGRQNAIKEQLEFARKLAIDRNADAILIVEADTIPPVDVLEKLAAHKKDVVGALFHYRTPEAPIVAWPKENITDGLCEVEGMGTGCVLLSRKAIESFSFYDWQISDCDYPMFEALRAEGFKVYLDADLVCKHYADADTCY